MTDPRQRNHPSSTELSTAIQQSLIPLIDNVMEGHGLAGLGIGIVADGEVLLSQGFGTRNVKTGEPVTEHSLFHLASVSKAFVGTAIMQLWERGLVELDAPVQRYLPYFTLQGEGADQVTVRQLLSHTSGVPDSNEYGWHQPEIDDGALERYVRSLAEMQMLFPPGERHEYSNPGFEVLGDLIAKVSGQTFEAYTQEHILEPLGMTNSTFLRADVDPALATTPHVGAPLTVLPGVYPYHRAHAPSSTLHSSPHDMCRWMLANLAAGVFEGAQILQPETYERIWHPEAETGDKGWEEIACLGWFRGTYRAQTVIHHSGSDPGYFADLVLLPDLNCGVMLMSNAFSSAAWGVTDAALDLLLGLDPTVPKCPVTVPLGTALQTGGEDAAVAEFERLQEAGDERYDMDSERFNDVTWGAIEMYQPEAVMDLVQLWVRLFPDDAEALTALGRCRMMSGELGLAERAFRRALVLDPENMSIGALLRRIVD